MFFIVFDINGWLENDRASIPHRLSRILSNSVTGNFQKSMFPDFLDFLESHFNTNCIQDGPWRSSVVPGCSLGHPGSSQNEIRKETKS
jgi:hypothetical protein